MALSMQHAHVSDACAVAENEHFDECWRGGRCLAAGVDVDCMALEPILSSKEDEADKADVT